NLSTDADNYDQTAWSPKFGVVYQPIQDKIALFANYLNGFSNVAPASDIVGGTTIPRTFNPEHAEQFEFGTKVNFFNDRVTGSISYYNIDVRDMVYTIYADNATPFPDQINVQNGRQRSKGIEVSVTANPIDGLNIIAGYSYNDSKLIEGDPDFQGKRPESAGPQNLANLWASYRFGAGALKGFGLGFGGNYASENKIMNRNLAGTFRLPEYTVLNASAFYDLEAFRFTVKVDNLTQEAYYKGWSTISPQRPRVFSAGMTYNF
ncbi:MAG TPA: TonB-dependent receptor, partial [Flavobacterium sp.]|nr:TonB-dependent receptor [Flavobacterium sp.]